MMMMIMMVMMTMLRVNMADGEQEEEEHDDHDEEEEDRRISGIERQRKTHKGRMPVSLRRCARRCLGSKLGRRVCMCSLLSVFRTITRIRSTAHLSPA